MLTKLNHYGIRGNALEWFRNYLNGRTQYVNYNGKVSLKKVITCGVPQGSVLGPLLFLTYINDVEKCLKKMKCVLFADDTTVYHSGPEINTLKLEVEKDLDVLSDCFLANKLSLSISKTNFMHYKKSKSDIKVSLRFGKQEIIFRSLD